MKTLATTFFILSLTLVVIPLIAEAEESDDAKKAAEDFCITSCADKKEPTINSNCKESCALNQRSDLVFFESVTCLGKCTQFDNVPDMKSCEEGCKKEYNAKAAEVTASCNAVCSKVEKDPHRIETCKMECTPPSS
ncbi:hypothetical protein BDA96_04G028800 [Sorghum bicolor]|jgi:hypothetical protein|uniref:Acidic protein n=2 Tax=Sorghum bicolor TaxID=4558 RepID=A0A921R330_SORBI|nr:hypothetical protein BDA96_04G028800 [Sorghum bicolor]OQU84281.1 hypothetical protein SORBI_3004G025600 [Sorghum bicolor]